MLELTIFISLGILIYLLFLLRDKKKASQVETPLKRVSQSDEANGVETPYIASPSEKTNTPLPTNESEGDECCGEHLVCERDSLLTQDPDIEYYDDEELDILSGINTTEYTEEQIKMLQDVFYTLRESDVAGWVRSLQMRNIELTPELRDEALLIVRERRTKKD